MTVSVFWSGRISCSPATFTPAAKTFDNVEHEVDYQVKRLSSHPSIALWCGDNELVGALTWFEEPRNNRDRYLVAYDRLNRTIEKALKKPPRSTLVALQPGFRLPRLW